MYTMCVLFFAMATVLLNCFACTLLLPAPPRPQPAEAYVAPRHSIVNTEYERHLHKNLMIMLMYKIHFDVICSKFLLYVHVLDTRTHKEGSGRLFHYFYSFFQYYHFVLSFFRSFSNTHAHRYKSIHVLLHSFYLLLLLLLLSVLFYWNKVSWEFTRFISSIIS